MKQILLLTLVTICLSCTSQSTSNQDYEIIWKINANEVIAYDLNFQAQSGSDLRLNWQGDEISKQAKTELNNLIDNALIGGQEIIIEKRDSKVARITIQSMPDENGIQMPLVLGTVYLNGGLESYFVENNQKSILAAMFELPQKRVKIGESWEIEFESIQTKGPFLCDKALRKRKATLISVVNNVATIEYDLHEYTEGRFKLADREESSTLKAEFKGIGKFLINNGRWDSYVLKGSVVGTGFGEMNFIYDIKTKLRK